MSKRMLVTSTDLMMIQFLVPHVKYLSEHGWKIEVACSPVGDRIEEVRRALDGISSVHVVHLYRNPAKPGNLHGYRELRRLIQSGSWDVIWTNEPVMGVMTRLAAQTARRAGTRVVYMVHGFHFYEGAPKRNWMIYYPIEREMSRFTDTIVTINHEDYDRAGRMHAGNVKYIHGIGVDTSRLHRSGGCCNIRQEIGVDEDAFIVLSVGELMPRKNQEVIIKALGILQDEDIHYVLCGKGDRLAYLQELADNEKVAGQVHFLGYRKDVLDFYSQADILAFPSRREGLGLAGLEAMYCGLPIVSSNINGLRDYMENGKTGYIFATDDAQGFAEGIRLLKESPSLREECGAYNRKAVAPFCLEYVKDEIINIFEEL
ncbi:MAG: glycosyltransferase family 4 protein [Lachnospiraceae bacterium]|nr:glycosyltransferase family 4 protein [Lachnospiraceae bacterium]